MIFCDYTNQKKVFLILVLLILLFTIKFFDSMTHRNENVEVMKSQPLSNEFLKVFHLDLKGGPPKLQYLLKILPLIRKWGANAILIEYEDMFPFSGHLKNLSARNAYTTEEVKRLIDVANTLKMEVIPLVQSFGHLEYVLKLKEFQSLRESENFTQEICPKNKDAVDLVKEIIKQCMSFHPNSRYIHLGCDEVEHIGKCSRCSGKNAKKLFANHVSKMAQFVRNEYHGVTPLIWDDMLRQFTLKDMEDSELGSLVEPVVWIYGPNIFTVVPPYIWNIYQRTFPKIWGASSFKGSSGVSAIVPYLNRHLQNNISWMKILLRQTEESKHFKEFAGIFVTGWSRYNHFAPLCELLPVGIPSLILSLTFLDPRFHGKPIEGLSEWLRILQCPPSYIPSKAHNEIFFESKIGYCSFPGSDLYTGMIKFEKLREKAKNVKGAVANSGWTSRYNFNSLWRFFSTKDFAAEIVKKEIYIWKSEFLPFFGQYFDHYTVSEWVEQNIKPLEDKLSKIGKNSVNHGQNGLFT